MKAFVETLRTLGFALAIAIVIRCMIFGNYKIPSASMVPTLLVGDHLFVSKLSYGLKLPIPFTNIDIFSYDKPKRGDVIVFQYPEDTSIDYIKRVIGVPGDTIEYRDHTLYVQNVPIDRIFIESGVETTSLYDPQLNVIGETQQIKDVYQEDLMGVKHPIQHLTPPNGNTGDFGPEVVPDGQYFVMGDNRDNSRDSRYWGYVPYDHIRGKAKIIWFSWDDKTIRWTDYLMFWKHIHIRFDRFLKFIH